MDWGQTAVATAGVVGTVTAVAHGFMLQRRVIDPLSAHLRDSRALPGTIERLIAPLLHVSTLAWLLGGIALIVVSGHAHNPLRPVVMAFVGALYLQAAVANARATRGRHFGWMLMAAAVALLVVGAVASGR